MKKFVCTVCGYVHEGDAPPAQCPICKAPAEKFKKQEGELTWAAEHVVGVAQGVREDILQDLRNNFEGECSEVGMYLAMARVAFREGYPEVGLYYEKAAFEEAEHAAKFAELLGEVVTDSTKKNLELRIAAENGATAGKTDLAKRAKELNLDGVNTEFYGFNSVDGFVLNLHFTIDFTDQPANQNEGLHNILTMKRANPSPWYGFQIRHSGSGKYV